jgi:ABC-type dipeptide/oligopeptide/nickel transport system permease subunit
MEDNQQYNEKIESLSKNILKVFMTFFVFPIILMLLTPLGYLSSLALTIITITIKNQIKRYVGKR